MLIGNAYRNTGMSSVTAPYGVVQLQIELEIISKLQELEYSVIYKKHPGGYYANKKLPFNNDVEVIESPFESIFHIADILFFYYTRTTTFGYALSSNKPIVVINSLNEEIEEESKELLQNQCSFLMANYNKNNRFYIDINQLRDVLNENKNNSDYFSKYLT